MVLKRFGEDLPSGTMIVNTYKLVDADSEHA
jgi:hypothetical protein